MMTLVWVKTFNLIKAVICQISAVKCPITNTVLLEKIVILIFVREKTFAQVYSNPDEFPVSLISDI